MSKSAYNHCFTPFKADVEKMPLPSAFTYPFCYQPHPLSILASKQLQDHLKIIHPVSSKQQGRMYGVLVVQNPQGERGYLSALSGSLKVSEDINNIDVNFVPPVCDVSLIKDFLDSIESKIININQEVSALEANVDVNLFKASVANIRNESDAEIKKMQQRARENKKARKEKRAWLAQVEISSDEIKQISINLSRESVTDKKELLALKSDFNQKIEQAENRLSKLTDEINTLKKTSKKLSIKLQKQVFKQYNFLNSLGENKDLVELFKDTIQQQPPLDSGNCVAPKLLQYAFANDFTPICMAEFWWGEQPELEIRKHKYYYPACQGKCQPILTHMLSGMTVDKNPLLINPAEGKELEIMYQDEHVVVVNKPAGLLSVPGKSITDSVYSRIKKQFPQATGSLIVHRLDMATSGLLMLALNERAHKSLQQQFINKEVSKRYVATINGRLTELSGKVCLPLRVDFNDRPKQMVCYEEGKYAETVWEVIEEKEGKTKLYLFPITGRTHQLRMHCAHPKGLNIPILGDGLYGTIANRLHLHAQRLSFTHPISKKKLTFEVDERF